MRKTLALCCLVGAFSWPAIAFSGEFVPVDEVVSNPAISLADPEFDPVDMRVAWQLGPNFFLPGLLLVADVDPNTGDILDPLTGISIPDGGAGLVIDEDLADRATTGNGPEWALGSAGGQIVYTKLDEQDRLSLARAQFNGSEWVTELLASGENRFVPEGSKDVDDDVPRIAYFGFVDTPEGTETRLAVRLIDFPFTERISEVPARGGNFIPDESSFLTTAASSTGRFQVFNFDYDIDLLEQITFGSGSKRQSPEPWIAPDFGDDMLFVVTVSTLTRAFARVYRRSFDEFGKATWLPVVNIGTPDVSKPFVGSPRPFVFEGKSYITFKTEVSPTASVDADIWIADLAPSFPSRFYRKLNEEGSAVRFDPENFMTTNGPIVYFSQISEIGIIDLH